MSIKYSYVSEVLPFVTKLARKHKLVCFDPQKEKVLLPSELRGKRTHLERNRSKKIVVRVIKHLKLLNFNRMTSVPFDEPKVKIRFRSVRVVDLILDREPIDEIHVFKSSTKDWDYFEYYFLNGVLVDWACLVKSLFW